MRSRVFDQKKVNMWDFWEPSNTRLLRFLDRSQNSLLILQQNLSLLWTLMQFITEEKKKLSLYPSASISLSKTPYLNHKPVAGIKEL